MKYKKGDKILQIHNGKFIRLGKIISNSNANYKVKWVNKDRYLNNLKSIKEYKQHYIENQKLFDLVNKDNINNVINKYISIEDYESCLWIKKHL